MERVLLQERRVDMTRDLDDFGGVEPLEVDMGKVFGNREIINMFYREERPTFRPPRVAYLPPGAVKRSLRTPFGTRYEVYVLNGGEEIVVGGLRYRRLKTVDASREPIVDTFYLLKFYDGLWSYYVPAGREFEMYYSDEDFITSTHYLVNFADEVIVDYPMGSITSTDDPVSNPRVARTIVLASKILPEKFAGVGTAYLRGELDSGVVEGLKKEVLLRVFEDAVKLRRVVIIEDP